MEKLVTIELIPYKNFKEKIAITKRYKDSKIEVWDKFIYVKRVKYLNDYEGD